MYQENKLEIYGTKDATIGLKKINLKEPRSYLKVKIKLLVVYACPCIILEENIFRLDRSLRSDWFKCLQT